MKTALTLSDHFDRKVFDAIYSRALVYNTCWEDPAVDLQALDIRPSDRMLVITSAGCNVLDYALEGPACIHAVDANPRQTALLELKLAGIAALEHADFFALFGTGRHAGFQDLYRERLRQRLSPFARAYWDRNAGWFMPEKAHDSFYYRGLSGLVARGFRGWLALKPKLREGIHELLAALSLGEQQRIYDERVAPLLWGGPLNWVLSRQLTMSLLGVPHPQRKEVERQHAQGIAGFVREAVEYVALQLPLWSNYFWSLYVRGHYTPDNCPRYLQPAPFQALKAGLAARIVPHTTTVTRFLDGHEGRLDKFVLLDHMDWMSSYYPQALNEEWSAILAHAAPRARVLFRSAHAAPRYLEQVRAGPSPAPLTERLRFLPELARRLHAQDRVHTYAGFHIAEALA